jgi:hypothetical protein
MQFRALSLCLLGCLSGCFWGVDGNGRPVTESRGVREVSQIDNDSLLDVEIVPGDRFDVRVRIDSNLQRHVETYISEDTLKIQWDPWLVDQPPGPHVLITMPVLTSLQNHGSGTVFAGYFEQDEEVEIELGGSGDLIFEGDVPRLRADLFGSGDMRLSGNTGFVELTLDGSGDIDALELAAAEADIYLDGSGDIRASVDGPVDARIDGSGDVDLSGEVERGDFTSHGSGNIHVH